MSLCNINKNDNDNTNYNKTHRFHNLSLIIPLVIPSIIPSSCHTEQILLILKVTWFLLGTDTCFISNQLYESCMKKGSRGFYRMKYFFNQFYHADCSPYYVF